MRRARVDASTKRRRIRIGAVRLADLQRALRSPVELGERRLLLVPEQTARPDRWKTPSTPTTVADRRRVSATSAATSERRHVRVAARTQLRRPHAREAGPRTIARVGRPGPVADAAHRDDDLRMLGVTLDLRCAASGRGR